MLPYCARLVDRPNGHYQRRRLASRHRRAIPDWCRSESAHRAVMFGAKTYRKHGSMDRI